MPLGAGVAGNASFIGVYPCRDMPYSADDGRRHPATRGDKMGDNKMPLTATFVTGKDRERGRYGDGGGLYLQVAKSGHRAWVFQYCIGGRRRAMGLGSVRVPGGDFASTRPLTLVEARDAAFAARKLVAQGLDPIDQRDRQRKDERAARARLLKFSVAAEDFHAANAHTWKNQKHRNEWISTLRRFAFPTLATLWCSDITTAQVCDVLRPLLATGSRVTAGRLR